MSDLESEFYLKQSALIKENERELKTISDLVDEGKLTFDEAKFRKDKVRSDYIKAYDKLDHWWFKKTKRE